MRLARTSSFLLIRSQARPPPTCTAPDPCVPFFPARGLAGCCHIPWPHSTRALGDGTASTTEDLTKQLSYKDMATSYLRSWPTVIWMLKQGILRSGFTTGKNNGLQCLILLVSSHTDLLICFWKKITTDRRRWCKGKKDCVVKVRDSLRLPTRPCPSQHPSFSFSSTSPSCAPSTHSFPPCVWLDAGAGFSHPLALSCPHCFTQG